MPLRAWDPDVKYQTSIEFDGVFAILCFPPVKISLDPPRALAAIFIPCGLSESSLRFKSEYRGVKAGIWDLSYGRRTIFGTPYCFPYGRRARIYSTMPRRSNINEFSDILQRRGDWDRWKPAASSSASYFSPPFSCHLSLSLSYTCTFIYKQWN